MRAVRDTLLRLLILGFAIGLPLGGAIMMYGPPPELSIEGLDQWSPISKPGPSTALLSQGVTAIVVGDGERPDWLSPDQLEMLAKANAALQSDRLKEALGHMLTLSAQLEDQGQTLDDILPVVMPDLATWMVANYFAPVLLGILLVALIILIFGPWLVRRFYDFLKLITTLVIGLIGIGFAVSLCFAIAQQKSLVFGLIEYLVVVATLLSVGNLIMFWNDRRRGRVPGQGPDDDRRTPTIPLTASREEPLGRFDQAPRPAMRAVREDGDEAGDPSLGQRPLMAPTRAS